jgi:hypothetical protein
VPGGPGSEDTGVVAFESAGSNSGGQAASGDTAKPPAGGGDAEDPGRKLDGAGLCSGEAAAMDEISLVEVSPSDASSNLDATWSFGGSSPNESGPLEGIGAIACVPEARGTSAATGFPNRDVSSGGADEMRHEMDVTNGLAKGELKLCADRHDAVEAPDTMPSNDDFLCDERVDGMEKSLEQCQASDGSTARAEEGVDRMEMSLDDAEASDGSTTHDSDTDVDTESSGSSTEGQDVVYRAHIPPMVCIPSIPVNICVLNRTMFIIFVFSSFSCSS